MFESLKKWLKSFLPEPVDVKAQLKNGAVLIDVRSPQEFKNEKIKGALNFPVQNIQQNVAKIKKMNKPVVLFCKSGGRAGRAKMILAKSGINAVNAGGYLQLKSQLR